MEREVSEGDNEFFWKRRPDNKKLMRPRKVQEMIGADIMVKKKAMKSRKD